MTLNGSATWLNMDELNLRRRFVPRTAKVPEEVLNRETVNRLYTGGTQEQLSGLVHLDARHYSPAKTKFVQPDPYSLTELSLPEEARHTLVKAAGLTLEGLLADPAQQLGNSYAGNNPLKWIDPLGLFDVFAGFEWEAVGITGAEGSFGIVIDTDDPMDSGFFNSGGLAGGGSLGFGVGVGFNTEDIEGNAVNLDFNLLGGSFTGTKNEKGNGWGVMISLGPGKGGSGSYVRTASYSLRDAWNGFTDFAGGFFGGGNSCP